MTAERELVPDEAELVLVPAHADAEPRAPAGELLQRRDLLCGPDRVVERHEHDRGPESDRCVKVATQRARLAGYRRGRTG